MKNGSFKGIKAAGAVSLILACILSAAICVLPAVIVDSICSSCYPLIEKARGCVFADDFDEALRELEKAADTICKSKDILMVFCSHDDVIKLVSTSKAAVDLAKVQDHPQLIDEINDMEWGLKLLEEICKTGARDVF